MHFVSRARRLRAHPAQAWPQRPNPRASPGGVANLRAPGRPHLLGRSPDGVCRSAWQHRGRAPGEGRRGLRPAASAGRAARAAGTPTRTLAAGGARGEAGHPGRHGWGAPEHVPGRPWSPSVRAAGFLSELAQGADFTGGAPAALLGQAVVHLAGPAMAQVEGLSLRRSNSSTSSSTVGSPRMVSRSAV